jgi:hypothetical protein
MKGQLLFQPVLKLSMSQIRKRWLFGVVVAWSLFHPSVSNAVTVATAAQAKAFVQNIYSDPLTYREGDIAPQFFDPALVALFREDQKLTPKQQIGGLDFVPFCWCQSDKGMQYNIGTVRLTSATTAKAVITLNYQGKMRTRMQIDLVTVNGQWRTHDITGADAERQNVGSLRNILTAANRKRSADAADTATVRQVLQEQLGQSKLFSVRKVALSNGYALVNWIQGEGGGYALLRKQDRKWNMVTHGGGGLDLNGLTSHGVPQSIAATLVYSLDH